MMTSASESTTVTDQQALDEAVSVRDVQSHYLRCPSPSFSTASDRFSVISGSEVESIFMEPIHLSSAIAAKKIINEELKSRDARSPEMSDTMLETAEQLMVEDLYNRVKDMMDDQSPYNTPCVLDIQRTLMQDRLEAPFNPVDEVWPNIYISEKAVAVNKARLKRMGITHIVNAAHGTGVYTGHTFYQNMNITYMGIEIDDFTECDISPHFRPCAEFLDDALLTHRGKVLVNSMMGVSRSAVLVAAYLMIFQSMSIMEALMEIRKKRAINPNEGFLKQLRQLNETLMEEHEEDDDADTLSQCSVIDTRAHPDEEEQSLFGVKAQSIMVEEEEDSCSIMSSVASSAAAMKAGILCGLSQSEMKVISEDPVLPVEERDDEDGDVDNIIREWQKRNEKYQSEEWWESQLMCDDGWEKRPPPRPEDLESVTSEDVRIVKERIRRRPRRAASDAGSTASCSSYSDLWKQRLKEIEEQAAARYQRKKVEDDDLHCEARQKKIDDDVESIMSESSSMYNFCKKNKDLSPLERWKIKRIQFGWNKKDGALENGEEEMEAPAALPEDVNLTAYQTWKLKQQRKHGGEENKDEILQMSRGEDAATAKRRQRRTELLERTRKTLEESQSMCGWETESALSTSIPLSAFCAGAFPSPSAVGEDNMSVLSGRSGLTAHSVQSLPIDPPALPAPVTGPNGEPMVNIANIQNWITSVVNETLIQKQTEMMMMMGTSLPPSRASSVFSRGTDDDKVSVLSGVTSSSSLSHCRAECVLPSVGTARSLLSAGGRAESVISGGGTSHLSSVSSSRKSKITTTSVPLYSLFQDQVNLHKLNAMEKEIKSDMRDKMASYEVKKITEDNKRSTLYKKKKQKDDEELVQSIGLNDKEICPCEKPKPKRDFGRSGILNLPTSVENSSDIDEWLKNVRPPCKSNSYQDDPEPRMSRVSYEEEEEPSELDFSSHHSSITVNEDEEENYDFTSRFTSRRQACHHMDLSRDSSPDIQNYSRFQRPSAETSYNVLDESGSYRSRSSFTKDQNSTRSPRLENDGDNEDSDDEEISAFIAQIKERARARVAEEIQEDEVLAAWKKQELNTDKP